MEDERPKIAENEGNDFESASGEGSFRKIAIIIVVAIAFVAVAVAGTTYFVHVENERAAAEVAEAHDEEVKARVADYQKLIEEYTPDLGAAEVDRDDALAKLPELAGLPAKIKAGQEDFKLSDGTLYLHDEVLKNATDGVQAVRDWFSASYRNVLDANSVSDPAADGVTRETLAASVAALEELKSLVETEKQSSVWQSEDECTAFIAAVQAEQDRQNDRIAELDAEEEARKAMTHVETEYFSLEVPESWGGDFTFEDHSLSESNRVWWLTPNTLDPFLPEQSDSRGYFGNYITIYVLGANNGNGDMGGLSAPYGAKFQTQELFRQPSGVHGGIIYPSKANGISKVLFRGSPSQDVYYAPSQQQVDDAAYIVSTFVLK